MIDFNSYTRLDEDHRDYMDEDEAEGAQECYDDMVFAPTLKETSFVVEYDEGVSILDGESYKIYRAGGLVLTKDGYWSDQHTSWYLEEHFGEKLPAELDEICENMFHIHGFTAQSKEEFMQKFVDVTGFKFRGYEKV